MARKNSYYQGPVSDHFDGQRFFNPGGIEPLGLRDLLRWQMGTGKAPWPTVVKSPFLPARVDRTIGEDALRVTMLGHATLFIQVAGLNILTDPIWSLRASPFQWFGPQRVTPPGIRFAELPAIDVVLITHNHYDHLDLASLKSVHRRDRPKIFTPLGNDTIIREAMPKANVTAMDWGDGVSITDGVSVHCEPCHHWSARGMRDRQMALWGAFVITTPVGKVYHVGDTGFHDGAHYRAVREKHGDIRLANLPIGAYEPRWFMEAQHQNPEEAVRGFEATGAAFAIGHHWGTFRLTDESQDAPAKALTEALQARNINAERFRALRPGEAFDVPPIGVEAQAVA